MVVPLRWAGINTPVLPDIRNPITALFWWLLYIAVFTTDPGKPELTKAVLHVKVEPLTVPMR